MDRVHSSSLFSSTHLMLCPMFVSSLSNKIHLLGSGYQLQGLCNLVLTRMRNPFRLLCVIPYLSTRLLLFTSISFSHVTFNGTLSQNLKNFFKNNLSPLLKLQKQLMKIWSMQLKQSHADSTQPFRQTKPLGTQLFLSELTSTYER